VFVGRFVYARKETPGGVYCWRMNKKKLMYQKLVHQFTKLYYTY